MVLERKISNSSIQFPGREGKKSPSGAVRWNDSDIFAIRKTTSEKIHLQQLINA